MKGNRKLVMAVIAVTLGLSGCKDNQTLADETLPVESVDEEENVLDAEPVDKAESPTAETEQQKEENDDTTEKEENDDVTEKEEKAVLTYRGDALLTEDNMEQVLKDFLTIADEDDLKKLEELPLTENFFNQCAEDFPYIENVEEYKEIDIGFWCIDEKGKCVSLVLFARHKNKEYEHICLNPDHVYCIEMDIIGDQIDALKLEFMR